MNVRWLLAIFLSLMLVGGLTHSAWGGLINLELRTATPVVGPGDAVEVELWFVSSNGTSGPDWISADVLLEWDSALTWVGYEDNPEIDILFSNTYSPSPEDPNQIWWTVATQSPVTAEPDPGILVTTFQFEATSATAAALIAVLPGDAMGDTVVLDDSLHDVRGALGSTSVTIGVDLDDFAVFAVCLNGPGVSTPPGGCTQDQFDRSDLDGDDDVDLFDFRIFQRVFIGP